MARISTTYSSENVSGLLFGNWVEIEFDLEMSNLHRRAYYRCVCKCKRVVFVPGRSLTKTNPTKSCGHCNDIVIGAMYGWLEPLRRGVNYRSPNTKKQVAQYMCECHYEGPGCRKFCLVRSGSLRSGETKSCGCLLRSVARGRVGDKNNNYKGGITDLSLSIRTCERNIAWQQACRERDNYTCQKCGTRGGNQPVHHIKFFVLMYADILTQGITSVGHIPEDSELWDIANGCTLCEDCHREFHTLYGIKSCTNKDFERWCYHR